jgi:AraC-like DNA-binding protein
VRPTQVPARRTIARALQALLRDTRIRAVHFAEAAVTPPALAYVTTFPRLSVPLAGSHPMEIARRARTVRLALVRGHAVFVGRNCWNRPDWSSPVKVLTFLFGKKQIGVSLVTHDGRRSEPGPALKTTLSPLDGPTQNILAALASLATQPRTAPLDRLLTESLLHACLQLLENPAAPHPRKAARTYEAVCLYVQEHFQSTLTRSAVARVFGVTPNHVSRLFRREGAMRFNGYVTLVRIDRAKFMLTQYGVTLKQIAVNCGYRDVAYFCRVFHRITKITPTEYRLKGL